HYDLVELQETVNVEGGAFDILFGQDEFLVAGLVMGVRGAVGCTYNFAGRHYRRLMKSFADGDIEAARAVQYQSARMVQILGKYGFMAAAKAVMGLIGVDCGPVRPPLRNLSREEVGQLAAELERLEILDRPAGRNET